MLMSNTVRSATVPCRRCDWCGDAPPRLVILPGADGVIRHRCAHLCRRPILPAVASNQLKPDWDTADGWYNRKLGLWASTAPNYCNWCGGHFHQWIRVWGDSSVGYDMPHCGRCEVPWGDEFAFGDRDHVHFHEYVYSVNWAKDGDDYFESFNPMDEMLKSGEMTPEGLYCMETGYCPERFLSVAGFVARFGVMGRSWVFQRLDWNGAEPYSESNVWDFRQHQALLSA